MVVDTSALLAILLKEADAGHVRLSAATAIELNLVAISRGGAAAVQEVDLLLERCDAEIVPVHGDQVVLARNAFLTFGKGRHPAKLNFGDCFSYALAKAYMEPLLYKGSDFAQTDIDPAL
jgi:ribonuclease VapC